MNLKFKFKLGLWVALPFFFLVFLAGLVFGTFRVWDRLIAVLQIPEFLHTPVSIVFTLLMAFVVGIAVTSKYVNWVFSRIPIFNKFWNPIKSIADRMAFASQGGYEIVMYNGYEKNTRRERPGIVLGRTTREYGDGSTEPYLVVMQPPPNVFDSLLIPYEDTEVLVGDKSTLLIYMLSGGIVNPPYIKTRKWTLAEYEEIPQKSQDDKETA